MNQNKRNMGYCLLRVIAALAIVVLHTAQYGTDAFEQTQSARIAALSLRNSMMWAVPCFVMVTGALLLDPVRALPLKKLFSKYISRIFLALLFFSAVFELTDSLIFHDRSLVMALRSWAEGILYAAGWKPLWYLYLLIGLYLLMPFYRMIAERAGRQEMRYLLLVLFVFQALIPTIEALTGKDIGFYIAIYSVYMLYLFLGYAIRRGDLQVPRKIIIPLLVISFAADILLTYLYISMHLSWLNSAVTRYSFVLIVLQAMLIFALFYDRNISEEGAKAGWISTMDSLSFGVYLIHLIYVRVLVYGLHFNVHAHGGIWMLLLCAGLIFILSMLTTFVCKKIFAHIPLLRMIL